MATLICEDIFNEALDKFSRLAQVAACLKPPSRRVVVVVREDGVRGWGEVRCGRRWKPMTKQSTAYRKHLAGTEEDASRM